MTGTYADLQARIADELDRTDLTSQIAVEILSAIRHYERQRMWFNEGRTTLSTTANQAFVTAPTDLLEIQRLDLTYNGFLQKLERRTWNEFENLGGTDTAIPSGLPTYYTFGQNEFWFYPIPSTVYTLTLTYIKQLTVLSSGTDSNTWTTDGEELIRSRARQAVKINYLGDAAAMGMIMDGYYSPQEKAAYDSLLRASGKRLARGSLTFPGSMVAPGHFNIYRG